MVIKKSESPTDPKENPASKGHLPVSGEIKKSFR